MFSFAEFADRSDAGRRLAAALQHLEDRNALVLALPRGGVPVGFEIARALGAELDVLIVRKIGAPWQEELGIGAVVDGKNPQLVINDTTAAMVGAGPDYIEREKQHQLMEIERRKRAYRGDRPDPIVTGRTVIVVDDGIATGGTMKAALRALRQQKPGWLVMAVPVAPPESLAELSGDCDELVCLYQPRPLYAVGSHYDDFRQTEDEEVVRLLEEARKNSSTTENGRNR